MRSDDEPILVWRNIVIWEVQYTETIVHVEWQWRNYGSNYSRLYAIVPKYSSIYPDDSSDELQFLKMLMDRYMVNLLSEDGHGKEYMEDVIKYICDIFRNPYEWSTKLLSEFKFVIGRLL